MEIIDLDPEETNELMFRVQIEGIDPTPAKIRLVCEGSDAGYVFKSKAGPEGLVRFEIPAMKGRIKEGTHAARVEVMIENKYFVPIEFEVNFKKKVSVVAESVVVPKRVIERPAIIVTATPEIRKVEKPALQSRREEEPRHTSALRERMEQKRRARVGDDSDDVLERVSRILRSQLHKSLYTGMRSDMVYRSVARKNLDHDQLQLYSERHES